MRLAVGFCALFLTAAPSLADDGPPRVDFHGLIDLRAVQTDEQTGWLDRGLGKSRFGGKRGEGDRMTGGLGEASLIVRPRFTWEIAGHLHLKIDKDQKSPIDVVEAFATWRPVSTSAWQFRARAGAFFPPVSMENIDTAWQSPYTITWSAINSWIGEEVRASGTEISGRYRYDGGELTLGGALFGGNDPAGTILHDRGWALHDRATGLFDALPKAATTANFRDQGDLEPFREVDGTPGLYLFLRAADDDIGGEFLLTVYDNFADETESRKGHSAWRTRFVSAGASYFLPGDIELIAQVMYGDTERGPPPAAILKDTFSATYLMLSGFADESERHRLSLRYDWFRVDDRNAVSGGRISFDEIGNAWTAAYSFTPDETHRLSFEVTSVSSRRSRRALTGEPAAQRDTVFQTSYRYSF